MKRLLSGLLLLALVWAASGVALAAGAEPHAILDRAIQALGGAERLAKVQAVSWTGQGTITVEDVESPITVRVAAQGLDHYRQEFEAEFGGNKVRGRLLVAGDKGSREFGGDKTVLDQTALGNEKRNAYLSLLPITLLPLKGKEYRLELLAGEKIDDKPAVGLKVTPPDGRPFRLYFDPENGLPMKLSARVVGFNGEESTEETTFSDYQEIAGLRKATRVLSRRNGEKFLDLRISDFKMPEQLDPKTFTE
jgi:hypothetical protein